MFSGPPPSCWQQSFYASYSEARSAWLAAIAALAKSASPPLASRSFAHPLHGPEAEALATDVLWLGAESADRVIVFISANHGVEGFVGSAVQRMLVSTLAAGELALPTGAAILFVHALNPWGMAWARRCDEQGIDLNRNFVDFNQPPPSNPHYAKLRPWLFEANASKRRQALAQIAAELGRLEYEMALSGGQYIDPQGPFYGGTAPAFGRQVIEQLMEDYRLAGRHLLVIDVHSGLGPWGYGELICDHAAGSANESYAVSLFGATVAMPERGTSSSVPKRGLLDFAWHAIMDARSFFLTLEFGTYATDALFDTLIDDHIFWANGGPDKLSREAYQQQRQRMLAHFCPDDIYWQQSVLLKSWQVADRLLRALA